MRYKCFTQLMWSITSTENCQCHQLPNLKNAFSCRWYMSWIDTNDFSFPWSNLKMAVSYSNEYISLLGPPVSMQDSLTPALMKSTLIFFNGLLSKSSSIFLIMPIKNWRRLATKVIVSSTSLNTFLNSSRSVSKIFFLTTTVKSVDFLC